MNKLVCLVGMCGSGKSEVSEYLMSQHDFGYVRFGQITLDQIKEMKVEPTEALEKKIREEMREQHGMAAYAILNVPKFDQLLEKSDVIGDGLYSWEEFLVLKEKYKDRLILIAVYSSPATRYARLENRGKRHHYDESLRFRSFTKEEAVSRDKSELENLHKGGPIAMADYMLINESTIEDLNKQIDVILDKIF